MLLFAGHAVKRESLRERATGMAVDIRRVVSKNCGNDFKFKRADGFQSQNGGGTKLCTSICLRFDSRAA
jgi:hypothetical protein